VDVKSQRTFLRAGSLIAVVPFVVHEFGTVLHPNESAKPGCVLMGSGCAHEHAGDPHAPSPIGRVRTEMTTTSTTPSVSSTTFAQWM
jgi:hypothetical protein